MTLKSNETSLGEKLREGRANTGLKQRQVADYLGLQSMAISNWERGVNAPSYEKLGKLAELYGVPVGWFFEEAA